jgi:chloride channel 7
MWLDLEPYYNKSPYSVRKTSSLARIFQLFRTVGLRHLAVVTVHNQVWLIFLCLLHLLSLTLASAT